MEKLKKCDHKECMIGLFKSSMWSKSFTINANPYKFLAW